MKSLIKSLIIWILAKVYFRNKNIRNTITILMYHEIAEDNDEIDSWTVIKKSEFQKQVSLLKKHFRIVTLDEILDPAIGEADVPKVVITFDDGNIGNHDVLLDIIEKEKIPITIFISTAHIANGQAYWFDRLINNFQGTKEANLDLGEVGLKTYSIKGKGKRRWNSISRLLEDLKRLKPEHREEITRHICNKYKTGKYNYQIRPLTINKIKKLSQIQNITIGGHSHCHNILTQLNNNALISSVRKNRTLLEDWTNKEIKYFAYPNGNTSKKVSKLIEEIGYVAALKASGGPFSVNLFLTHDKYHLPRIGIGRYDSIAEFKIKLLGGINNFIGKRQKLSKKSTA